jgi:hypothetical protein
MKLGTPKPRRLSYPQNFFAGLTREDPEHWNPVRGSHD